MDYITSISNKLNEYLKNTKTTKANLCKQIKMSRQTLNKLLKNEKVRLSLRHIYFIAKLLNTSLSGLFAE